MTYDEIVHALRYCSYGCVCEKCPSRHTENCIDHVNVSAAAAIERLVAENVALREKVPQWISVEDSLPEVWENEEDGALVNYMIYSPEFGVDIGNYHAKAERWLCVGLPCTVTHWMPLPDGPKEA